VLRRLLVFGKEGDGVGREGKWEATAVGRGAEVEVEVEVETHAATSKRVAATHPADPGGSAVTHGSGPHGFPALPILRMRCSGTIRVCLVLEASGP
jgi:hypothetical protein